MTDAVFTTGRWFVAFHDSGTKRWWDYLFTRKGFRHCFAFRYLEPMDAWAIVDWGNEGLFVEFMPKRFVDSIIVGVNDGGGCFLEVEVKERNRRMFPFQPLYCVTAIKDLVGLRNWRVLTPWQLHCALKKQGAKQMFDLSNGGTSDGRRADKEPEGKR